MSNARVEGINNKIGLIVRRAYGFRNLSNLFSMLMLECSNLEMPLPYQLESPSKALQTAISGPPPTH